MELIAQYNTSGCCMGQLYDYRNQSCCYNYYQSGDYDVINSPHACQSQYKKHLIGNKREEENWDE